MIKRLLLIFALCVSLPAFAGVFEDALKTGNNVFLYLYTPECKYCNEFNPVYQRLAKNYGDKIRKVFATRDMMFIETPVYGIY